MGLPDPTGGGLFPGGLTNGGFNGGHWQANAQSGPGHQSALAQQAALAQHFAALGALAGFAGASVTEPEDTGLEVGEIIAWRAWKVSCDRLYSAAHDYEWTPGECEEAHKIGVMIGDGIHAWKNRKQAFDYAFSGMVVGEVDLWGQIYEFERGWHAEFARVRRIHWIKRDDYETRKPPLFGGRREWRRRMSADQALLDRLNELYATE